MVLPADLHTTNMVLREAQFFQLAGLIELLQAQKRRCEQVSDTLLSMVRYQQHEKGAYAALQFLFVNGCWWHQWHP